MPNFRENFSDDELRGHASTCDGFFFEGFENRNGIKIPIGRVNCESCAELERRVRAGPLPEDLPIASKVIPPYRDPSLNRNIPDSALLAIMPTSTSDKNFIEEYQKRKRSHQGNRDIDDHYL